MKISKILAFSGNLTQYHAPFYKLLNKEENVDLTVLYADKIGAEKFYSKEFNAEIKWDKSLLEGYKSIFFKNLSSSDKKGFFSRNNPSIIKYIIKNDAQYVLIHGYDTLTSWYVYLAAIISRKKIIWRGESIKNNSRNETFKKEIIHLIKIVILPLYFKICHKILYSCKMNYEYLNDYILDKDKLISFPCAVDNNFFKKNKIIKTEEINTLKRKYNIDQNKTIITTCSRLTKRKRTDIIIKAIAESGFKNKTIFLVLGDGPERKNLETLSKNLNVNSIFLGFSSQETIAKIHSISNIFILMSIYDASPKALNEALNFNQMIITSSGIGTSKDLVINNKNGFIVNNKDELKYYIELVLKDKNELERLSSYNDHIINDYSYEKCVTNLQNIFS